MMFLAAQNGLRVSDSSAASTANVTLGDGPHVRCEGKCRKRRAAPSPAR